MGVESSGWDTVWAEAWVCESEQPTSSEALCLSGVNIYRNPPGRMNHSFPSPHFHPFALSPEHSQAPPTCLPILTQKQPYLQAHLRLSGAREVPGPGRAPGPLSQCLLDTSRELPSQA